MKNLFNIALVVICAFISYAVYSIGESGNLRGYNLLPMIATAVITSALVTLFCFTFFKYKVFQYIMSIVLSYAAYSVLLIGIASIRGILSDTLMWFPLILWYALFAMFPLTAGTVYGTSALLRSRKYFTEQGLSG